MSHSVVARLIIGAVVGFLILFVLYAWLGATA